MPFLVFTGCKQPDSDTQQPNIEEREELVETFSKQDNENKKSVVQAIREAAEKDNSPFTLNLWVRHENGVWLSPYTDITTEGLTLYNQPVDGKEKNSPAEITIEGNRAIVKLGGEPSGHPLITVGNGVKLTLRDITFKGLSANTAPLIKVEKGGKLIMDSGAVITENCNADGNGGGVLVEDGGIFEMREGKIHNNKAENGGGVYIDSHTTKSIMYGGEISGNTAMYGGGVYVASGTFV
jgi:hypothetical protein